MMLSPTQFQETGDFYEQIHNEIKTLRNKVNQRLNDIVSGSNSSMDFLNQQLNALKDLSSDQGMQTFAAASQITNPHPTNNPLSPDQSFEDLKTTNSAATEPATNLTTRAVARRLHQINFPDDVLEESENESETDRSQEYKIINSRIVDQVIRPSTSMPTLNFHDAITAAREASSPTRRRFFPESESERFPNNATSTLRPVSKKTSMDATKRTELVPTANTPSPYAPDIRNALAKYAMPLQKPSREVQRSFTPFCRSKIPSLADTLESPVSQSISGTDTFENNHTPLPDPSAVSHRSYEPTGSTVSIRESHSSPPVQYQYEQQDISPKAAASTTLSGSGSGRSNSKQDKFDEMLASLDHLDRQQQKQQQQQKQKGSSRHSRRSKQYNQEEKKDDCSVAFSTAASEAQSVASRSVQLKASNLECLAHSSVTDSMALQTTEGNAELLAMAGNGIVRIEKVQGRVLCDPYGDQGRYTGLLVKAKPYGHGTMHYDDGRSYTGDWKNGRWHGKGRTLFVNGDFYVGEYVKDQRVSAQRMYPQNWLLFGTSTSESTRFEL
jgi:hypothetical protein